MKTSSETATVDIDSTVRVNFGEGRYSAVMGELYRDSQNYLNISSQQAERLARSFGAELGRLQAGGEAKVTLGRLNKDGAITLREACKIKCVMTNPIAIAKIISLTNEAMSYGLNYSETSIGLNSVLTEWLTGEKVNGQ